MNLYRDDDIIKELEQKVLGMTLEDKVDSTKIKSGKPGDFRQIKKAVRKTAEGKES